MSFRDRISDIYHSTVASIHGAANSVVQAWGDAGQSETAQAALDVCVNDVTPVAATLADAFYSATIAGGTARALGPFAEDLGTFSGDTIHGVVDDGFPVLCEAPGAIQATLADALSSGTVDAPQGPETFNAEDFYSPSSGDDSGYAGGSDFDDGM